MIAFCGSFLPRTGIFSARFLNFSVPRHLGVHYASAVQSNIFVCVIPFFFLKHTTRECMAIIFRDARSYHALCNRVAGTIRTADRSVCLHSYLALAFEIKLWGERKVINNTRTELQLLCYQSGRLMPCHLHLILIHQAINGSIKPAILLISQEGLLMGSILYGCCCW